MKVAATMAKDARQAERDAWALAALESASRPQVDPTTALIRRPKGGDQ